jgi:two-component system LytT family sensor kinase
MNGASPPLLNDEERHAPPAWRDYAVAVGLTFIVTGLLAAWDFGSLYGDAVYYKSLFPDGQAPALPQLFYIVRTESYGWFLLSPVVGIIGQAFLFQRGRWLLASSIHVPAALICAITNGALWIWLTGRSDEWYLAIEVTRVSSALVKYAVLIAVINGVAYHRTYRQRELRASTLQAQLARTQLQMLQMQLRPHFLFNTLNAISTLLYRDPDAADSMISRLSELLRASLAAKDIQEVRLRAELEYLDRYLEIEQVRFGDRLEIVRDVGEDTLDTYLPNLILQPLIENAIKHGLGGRSGGGRITIRARRDRTQLILEVEDDGVGLPEREALPPFGVGLSNTRARLEQLYGANGTMDLLNREGEGLTVRLTIPAHTMPALDQMSERNASREDDNA